MYETLFTIGYKVSIINILLILLILLITAILRRLIRKNLKKYITHAKMHVVGTKVTWLKFFSQLTYLLALYLIIISFRINNQDVTFSQFLDYSLIESKYLVLSFWHVLLLILLVYGVRITTSIVTLLINKKLSSLKDYDPGIEYIYIQISKYLIYLVAFYIGLRILDVDMRFLLGSSAALLIGIGFGLQDLFRDFFSGIVLLLEGNIKIGDVIEMNNQQDSEPIVAKIVKVNVRTTHIETREGNVLIIPNSKLTQETIENWSHGSELSRFTIPVQVAYGSDIQEVMRLMKQAALGHPKVKKTNEPTVRLADFQDNGIKMELIFWADQSWDINNFKGEIRVEIDRLFREYKITIPYPQRDLHIIKGSKSDSFED